MVHKHPNNTLTAIKKRSVTGFTSKQMKAILEKAAWRCAYCGALANAEEGLSVEFVRPLKQGEEPQIYNSMVVCERHNYRKFDMHPLELATGEFKRLSQSPSVKSNPQLQRFIGKASETTTE